MKLITYLNQSCAQKFKEGWSFMQVMMFLLISYIGAAFAIFTELLIIATKMEYFCDTTINNTKGNEETSSFEINLWGAVI